MTQVDQIYKCNICGNVVKVLESGAGQLVCCGQSMELQGNKEEEGEN
ncbi:desulfoferrodoxin FeS4 iron-binding domain-containing protein [Patescibacteria group bacterium]